MSVSPVVLMRNANVVAVNPCGVQCVWWWVMLVMSV